MTTPFRFEAGSGPLRLFHPLAKLAALLLVSASAMAAHPPALAGIAAASGLLLASTGAGIAQTAIKARFLAGMALFVALVKTVDAGPDLAAIAGALAGSALYASRLALVFLQAEAFFRTTSPHDLGAALTRAARRLARREDIDPGLYLTLAVDFLPRTFEAYERSREAADARGFALRGKGRVSATIDVLASFIGNAVASAARTARALEARGYDPARTVPAFAIHVADVVLVTAAAAIRLAAALVR
ncbi:MAG: hypothetical protein NT080_08540 [Spirochaetes bacterium]|nr:hypothetical protein [Spirochaetota bacterium]